MALNTMSGTFGIRAASMTRFAGRTRRIVGRVVQAIVCRPYRGLGGLLADVTHGLRRGLESVAPPGLLGALGPRPDWALCGRLSVLGRTLVFLLIVFLTACGCSLPGTAQAADPDAYDLLDSGQHGALNIGESQASVERAFDSGLGKDVLKLDYSVPKGSAAGVWTKGYPAELARDVIDIVSVGVKVADAQQASQISVKLEVKGTTATQTIPLELCPGWSQMRQRVEWDRIGDLAEVVFVVDAANVEDAAVGALHLDCSFGRLPLMEKVGSSVYGRLGAVMAISVMAAVFALILTSLLGGIFGKGDSQDSAATEPAGSVSVFRAFPRDLAFGTAAVLMIVLAFAIQWLGTASVLEAGYVYLAVALLGGLVAELWKLGQAGRHLTPGEVFRDVLATGVLAASASSLSVWQAPGAWSDLLMLSSTGAAVFCLIYHIVNACLLTTNRKHISAVGSAITVAIPCAFGLLLALQSGDLIRALADVVTGGAAAELPAGIGAALLLFGFGECLINAFSLLTERRLLRSPLAHVCLLAFAVLAVVAPRIADLGSGAVAMPAAAQPFAALVATMLSQGGLWALVFLLTGVILDGMRGGAPSAGTIFGHGMSGLKKGMVFSGILMGFLLVLNAIVHWPVAQAAYRTAPWLLLALGGALAYPLLKTIVESFDGSQSFFGRAKKAYGIPVLYARGIVIGLAAWHALRCDFFALTTAQRIWYGFMVGALAYAGVSILRDVILSSRGQGSMKPWRTYFVEVMLG